MLFKLSARNVKRSFKDYAIYFLTLTFAVCIFYSFNSLSGSSAMTHLSASQSDTIEMMLEVMSIISIFVSVVLGFLILYANNFLVRRRKKELGMYMTLGMSKYKISQLLVMETVFVGFLSLVTGLLLGLLVSQGLSTVTMKLFKADMSEYTFVFSQEALSKTVLYFSIIFLLVMFFNSFLISRYKLIDLLTAAKKNEKLKIRKTSTSVVLFVLSILLLAVAYGVILKYGLFESMNIVWLCVGLGSLGTLLFFMSLSGFILNMIQRNINIYYKGLNMFVLRQINSKINTTFISMTVICLMLFFTIGVFSTGFSLKSAMETDVDEVSPYDASLSVYVGEEETVHSVSEATDKMGIDLDSLGEYEIFTQYQATNKLGDILSPYKDENLEKISNFWASKPLNVLKQSDFRKIMDMQGQKVESLKNDEVLLLSNAEGYETMVNGYADANSEIVIEGKTYSIKNHKINDVFYKTSFYGEDILTAVVPDEAVANMKPEQSIVNINYVGDAKAHDELLYKKLSDGNAYDEYGFFLSGYTKSTVFDISVGNTTLFVFIAIYLGIVFLISSAAVLALQQLSEASDSMDRYTILRKIGVPQKGIHQAIFRQIFVYFMMPLSLAIVHSIFGIKVVNETIMSANLSSVLWPSFIVAFILIIVYGGYFLATYMSYKNIVKS